MFKKIFIILLVFTFSAHAEIVKEIQVEGNDRISSETIKVYGDIELGRDYSNIDINNILKNLYSTDFFENVTISIINNKLIINVIEYSVINEVLIEGEKSKAVRESILKGLSLKSKESYIPNKLPNDITLIKKAYASIGYNFVNVTPKIDKFSDKRLNIIYNVDRGSRTSIKNINFIGDKKIRDSRLRDIIVSEEKKFWKFLSNNVYYNQSNVELDQRLLINYYKSLGYYDVQVLSSNAEVEENNFTELTYTINAGNRYKVSKIITNVDPVINKTIFAPLDNVYLDYVGKYYSPFKVKKVLDEVDLLIANADLQFIEHSVSETIEGENIEIKINIFEGKKELVERVNIYGNTVTDESVIRSELLLDEGDPFNKLKLDQSLARLNSRNIFGEIKPEIIEGSKKDQKVINITVEEKPTGEITAGAGVGTDGGSFAFSITENNWLGKGISLSTNLDVSSETFTGGFSIVDPNYKSTGNSVNYYVENTKNDKPDSGFENNIIAFGAGTKFEQYKDIFLAPNLVFSYDDLKVNNSASTSLQKQKGTFTDLSFNYSIINDRRDRAYGPTEGHITTFGQNIPLYADSPYIRNSIGYNKYQSFTPNLVGAFKFYASAVNGLNKEDVRLSKRIFLNSTRLRGFESGKVGPKDGADYVGGNYAMVSNFEVNLPNLLPESTKTDVGLFLDFANIWHVDYSESIDDTNKIRSSAGLNTSWMSPVGPMTFIFSQNISKATTDVTQSFNFRLGTTF